MTTDIGMRTGAIGYVRVSTKAQGENGYSLAAQRDMLEKYCAAHDYDLLAVIPDVMSVARPTGCMAALLLRPRYVRALPTCSCSKS